MDIKSISSSYHHSGYCSCCFIHSFICSHIDLFLSCHIVIFYFRKVPLTESQNSSFMGRNKVSPPMQRLLIRMSFWSLSTHAVFYPISHIAAVTANRADHWNFSERDHRRGIDVVSAGASSWIILHTHDIPRMALQAAPCIFHCQFPVVANSRTAHSDSKTIANIQRAGVHVPTNAATSSIISGTRYFRGWCHKSLSVFQPRIGCFHSRWTDRMALCRAYIRGVPTWTKSRPPRTICQLHR